MRRRGRSWCNQLGAAAFWLGIVSYPHLNDALCFLACINWGFLSVALNHEINLDWLTDGIQVTQLFGVSKSCPTRNCSSDRAHLK